MQYMYMCRGRVYIKYTEFHCGLGQQDAKVKQKDEMQEVMKRERTTHEKGEREREGGQSKPRGKRIST